MSFHVKPVGGASSIIGTGMLTEDSGHKNDDVGAPRMMTMIEAMVLLKTVMVVRV